MRFEILLERIVICIALSLILAISVQSADPAPVPSTLPSVTCTNTSAGCSTGCGKGSDGSCYVQATDNSQCSNILKEIACLAQNQTICQWRIDYTKIKDTSEEESETFYFGEEEAASSSSASSASKVDPNPKKCYPYVEKDPCSDLTSEQECRKSQKLFCEFNNTCIRIPDAEIVNKECEGSLSQLACKSVTKTNSTCGYDTIENKCTKFDQDKGTCTEAYNKLACDLNFDQRQQCIWEEDKIDQVKSKCRNYRPKVCKGDNKLEPIKRTCEEVSVECKWNLKDKACVDIQRKEKCNGGTDYETNKYGCVEASRACAWKPVNDSLTTYNGTCEDHTLPNKDTNCTDGRNKWQCRRSSIACAWDQQCVKFDNYTHNCNDNLSASACKQVPFPCSWNPKLFDCKWFDDPTQGCPQAANEVACLIANEGCKHRKWTPKKDSLYDGNCTIDKSLQAEDSFWQAWDEKDFNEEFIKQFFAAQLKAADEASAISSDSSASVSDQPLPSVKNDTDGAVILTGFTAIGVGLFGIMF